MRYRPLPTRTSPVLLCAYGLFLLLTLSSTSPGTTAAAGTSPVQGGKQAAAPTTCAMNFADVNASDYYYEAVHFLFCEGAIGGYPDSTFRPGNDATRAQLSKIVVIAEGWPLVSPPAATFSDVPVSSPFFPYVETARLHGVISGYADGSFRPNTNITRAQLSKVMVLAQSWPLINPPAASFADVPVGSPFYAYVETAAAHGVVNGYAGNTFRPGYPATRGQISKIVYFSSAFQPSAQEQQTVDLINQRRAAMGLGALRFDPALGIAARWHSDDIGPLGLCQHNGTDGSSPWDRIAGAGYTGSARGEVVGCNYATAQGVVDAWWASPEHYAILTDASINDIGCGWWIGANGYGWQTCDTGVGPR